MLSSLLLMGVVTRLWFKDLNQGYALKPNLTVKCCALLITQF